MCLCERGKQNGCKEKNFLGVLKCECLRKKILSLDCKDFIANSLEQMRREKLVIKKNMVDEKS